MKHFLQNQKRAAENRIRKAEICSSMREQDSKDDT